MLSCTVLSARPVWHTRTIQSNAWHVFLLLTNAVMCRTLWFDRHGNWHVVFHVYKTLPFHAHEEVYSGHAFSADGIDWTFSHVEPYNGAEIKRLF